MNIEKCYGVVYIAGKMTNLPDLGRAKFAAAAKKLRDKGFSVLNPAELPDGMPGTRYMPICLAMIAEAYIPNPNMKPYINHKDGNTKNNSVSNLEWCTPLENVEHAANVLEVMSQYSKANEKRKKPVACFDWKTRKFICNFPSIYEAAQYFNIPSSNIVACLKGRQAHTRKMSWCYVEALT